MGICAASNARGHASCGTPGSAAPHGQASARKPKGNHARDRTRSRPNGRFAHPTYQSNPRAFLRFTKEPVSCKPLALARQGHDHVGVMIGGPENRGILGIDQFGRDGSRVVQRPQCIDQVAGIEGNVDRLALVWDR